jgi:phosphoribosylformylglycinamidine (FGAM) synthase-like amidotransferase family enzyme
MPINHFEGSYYCDQATLAQLRARGQVLLRYVDNPNGSIDDIAAVADEAGTVLGVMPHPERACEDLLGSSDGAVLLASVLEGARVPAAIG